MERRSYTCETAIFTNTQSDAIITDRYADYSIFSFGNSDIPTDANTKQRTAGDAYVGPDSHAYNSTNSHSDAYTGTNCDTHPDKCAQSSTDSTFQHIAGRIPITFK